MKREGKRGTAKGTNGEGTGSLGECKGKNAKK